MFEENNSVERETPAENTAFSKSGSGFQNHYVRPYPAVSYDSQPTTIPQKQVSNYTPSYGVGNARVEKRKSRGTGKLIALFAIIIVLAILVGGVGGYLAASLKLNGVNAHGTSGNVVVYEAVDNGSSSPVLSAGSTIADISKKVSPSVVEITTEVVQSGGFMSQYIKQGAGSGIIVSTDGYIVTNDHVIDGAKKITVILDNGNSYSAKLIGTDSLTDIAVIKIEVEGLIPAVYGKSGELRVGDFALAVGNPLGKLGGTVTSGIISALEREVVIDNVTMTLLQTNAAINPGNSGGGLFNSSAELIGVVNAKAAGEDIEGLGFAIPIDIARPVIEDLIEYGYVTGRVQAGIRILDVLDYATAFQYRVNKLGPYIYTVYEDSDAERAGIKQGDLVMKIDDTLVYESADILAYFADCEAGDTIIITVERGGEELQIPLTFTEYKPQ